MKKAFTLIELIFVIILIGIISYYLFENKKEQDFQKSVNVFLQNVDNILNNAVMDPVKGYVNGNGGDCSSDRTYRDISAGRAIDCIGWKDSYPYGGVKSENGTESYVYKLLRDYTANGEGCKLYLGENTDDAEEYYLYIDCSNLNYGNDRYKQFIEEKLLYNISTNFNTIFQNVDRNATGLYTPTGGTQSDGKIRFLMKK